MASLRLSHSDQHGLALPGETHTDQVHLFIATVDPGALNPFESLLLQSLERGVAAFLLKPFFRLAVEPSERASAVVAVHCAEEGAHHVLRTDRRLLRAAEAQRSNQEAAGDCLSQVPEQDGANSSSSAAETNSSLHQNDAREWPFRTHWSWS